MKNLFKILAIASCATTLSAKEIRLVDARTTIYQRGVPHFAADGQTRFTYDENDSFFPLAIYHPTEYMFENQKLHPTPFNLIKKAGFNTLHFNRHPTDRFFDIAKKYGFKVIKGGSSVEEAKQWAHRPEILMWEVFDEPDGDGVFDSYPSRFEHFRKYYEELRKVDKTRPIFVNTVSWIENPNRPWLIQWHQVSDISCHDNYPKKSDDTPSWSGSQGITESMELVVDVTRESKPVLFIVQAFGEMDPPEPNERFHLAYPTNQELRSMVFTAIVKGAVGMDYFTFDNSVCRNAAQLYGINPTPLESYEGAGNKLHANKERLAKIVELWNETERINHDLIKLKPWILSPTSKEKYDIFVDKAGKSKTPIRAILKNYDNRLVMLLVNVDKESFNVTIKMPKVSSSKDFFTGAEYVTKDNKISIPMGEFDVKVIEIKK